MITWYFPQEVWKIIKQYENDLLFPEKYRKYLIKEFKTHIHAPFWMSMSRWKSYEYQYDYLKKTKPELWEIYSDKKISKQLKNEIKYCVEIYY
tara:strand:+ start:62 stop:340 length:279 start_codon:yes stop_codon:yes gene_type:complete